MTPDLGLPDKRMLRIDEVARVLRVTPRQVRNMIQAGRLSCIEFSPRVRRIPRDSVVAAARKVGLDVDYRK